MDAHFLAISGIDEDGGYHVGSAPKDAGVITDMVVISEDRGCC